MRSVTSIRDHSPPAEAPTQTGLPAERPLFGVKVVDFTLHAAGPYCTLVLALLGAEVIRIESRARLDIQRRPHPVYGRDKVPNWDYLAGHKKSITLNLKRAAGARIVKELIAISDVVVENFRPGVMQRLGLDWPRLRTINSRLAMVSISAYGQEGPDSLRPGYAPIFAAEGGLGHLTGYRDGPPGEIRNQMDHEIGLTAAFVVLSLLEERERSGQGDYADLAAREVATMLAGESVLQALTLGHTERLGNAHEIWCPHGVFRVAGEDRWLALAVRTDEEWLQLVNLIGSDSLRSLELSTVEGRQERSEFIEREVANWTRDHDGRRLAARLQAVGICADISMSAKDILEDDHLQARRSITTLRHPEYGEQLAVQAPWRFSSAQVNYERWSPELGEHNEEIICGLLGHERSELDQWIEQGVVD